MESKCRTSIKDLIALLDELDEVQLTNASLKQQSMIQNKIRKQCADTAIVIIKLSQVNLIKNK